MTMDSEQLQERLEFAREIARHVADEILRYYRADDLEVELKGDSSPVTLADRNAEQLLRERIAERYPDDSILGEEFDDRVGSGSCRWILDPIDGTKSFIHGVPLFGTLIGMQHETDCLLGVCHFPALDEMYFAGRGLGAWQHKGDKEPERIRVSKTASLDEALFCSSSVTGWAEVGRRDAFEDLCEQTRVARTWGDCYGYMLVASGRGDVMVDPQLNEWDCAAILPIVTEAGGEFLDWKGKAKIDSGNGFATSPTLKDAVLTILAD